MKKLRQGRAARCVSLLATSAAFKVPGNSQKSGPEVNNAKRLEETMTGVFKRFTKTTFLGLLLSCCVGLASAAGGYMTTFGSRGTVTPTATMYGAFTLVDASIIYIAVRGPSLWTLGVTLNPLDLPNLRVLDAYGNDLLTNVDGGNFINGCPSTGSSPGVYVASYYYYVRGEPLDERDTCTYEYLSAGVYTFMITPNSAFESGEVLFEVTVNPDEF